MVSGIIWGLVAKEIQFMKFGLGENKVRVEGLEPPCREALAPKSSVSTNFTTPAGEANISKII